MTVNDRLREKTTDASPVAEVYWFDPRIMHPESKSLPHKKILANDLLLDSLPVGTKLYAEPPRISPEIIARIEAMQRHSIYTEGATLHFHESNDGPLVFINDVLQILRGE